MTTKNVKHATKWFAAGRYDQQIERVRPDVSELVNGAVERYLKTSRDERDRQAIVETEVAALTHVLFLALEIAEHEEAE